MANTLYLLGLSTLTAIPLIQRPRASFKRRVLCPGVASCAPSTCPHKASLLSDRAGSSIYQAPYKPMPGLLVIRDGVADAARLRGDTSTEEGAGKGHNQGRYQEPDAVRIRSIRISRLEFERFLYLHAPVQPSVSCCNTTPKITFHAFVVAWQLSLNDFQPRTCSSPGRELHQGAGAVLLRCGQIRKSLQWCGETSGLLPAHRR